MLTIHLTDLRCTLCKNLFSPPSVLPHLLPCTHYICTSCIQKAQTIGQNFIICPDDLEINTIKDIKANCPARKMLQKLVNQHTKFNQSNQLLSIQALSEHFENVVQSHSKEKVSFEELIERVIGNEIDRLKNILKNIKEEMYSPIKTVKEWKEMVKDYLMSIRTAGSTRNKQEVTNELNYFIEQGRSIKSEIMRYQNLNYSEIANTVAVNPSVCFRNSFSLLNYLNIQEAKQKGEQVVPEDSNHKESDESRRDLKKSSVSQFSRLRINHENAENLVNLEGGNPISFDYHSRIKEIDFKMNKSSEIHFSKEIIPRPECPLDELDSNLLYDQKLVYSSSPSRQEVLEIHSDELLLTENEPKKHQNEKYNFLQKWEFPYSVSSDSVAVERREPFSWQKEKNSYIKKMQSLKVEEAVAETLVQHNTLELINFEVGDLDMNLYLQSWDWDSLEVVKFVKTGLTDQQFNELLNFTIHSKVTTLVLSSNCLGQISLDALLNFTRLNSTLKNVYLSKNQINPLKGKARQKVLLLKEQGINLYI